MILENFNVLTKIFSTKDNDFTTICVKTEIDITFANVILFNFAIKDVLIKIMITSITVRDLNIKKHFIDKYVNVFMYFAKKNENDNVVKAKITRKVHLINDLKTNMFIENNVLNLKIIDIFTSTFSVYIESYDVIVSIFIKNRFIARLVSIHSTKA